MATHRSSGPVIRSSTRSPKFNRHYSTHSPPSHSFASTTTSTFTAARSFQKPASPTPVNLYNYPTPSLTFSLNQPGSPNRSISFSSRSAKPAAAPQKRTCMCSPTNHPGSFRCSLHKGNGRVSNSSQTSSYGNSSRLNMRRSAMKNSLVRIGTVEGDLVKRALAAFDSPLLSSAAPPW